jgi:hypothetical protein
MRSACRREIFYKEHDGQRYCILHYPGAEKKEDFKSALQQKLADKDFDFTGVWFPDDVSFENITFSAAAYFSGAQFNAVVSFSYTQFSAIASFRGAQFSAVAYFRGAQFSAEAYFRSAQFSKSVDFCNAQFSAEADFRGTQFSAAVYFNFTQFSATASLRDAQFNAEADFSYAQFRKRAEFDNAVFNQTVSFQGTGFIEEDSSGWQGLIFINYKATGDEVGAKAETIRVSFAGASFKDGVSFKENEFAERVFMSFAAAIFEKPERATFHTVHLHPHWFVNMDLRRFTFINVSWGLLDKRDAIRKEVAALERAKIGHLSHLLEITLRQLAVNAEENNRYEEAANFRYMAMEARRLQSGRKLDLFRLSWWYWLLSGYGERVTRAFLALITIWLLFAVVYSWGDATWWQPKQSARLAAEMSARDAASNAVRDAPQAAAAPLALPEAVIYSAGVMALQKPEPLPANKRAKAFVLFETILGPLQAALLALAIRRKFMR